MGAGRPGGDSKADGFMSLPFMRAVDASTASAGVPAGTGDITGLVTADMVKRTFPAATRLAKIAANLPFVLAGLRARQLGDRAMVLMSIATIRAETEGFVPIDEGRSKFNTRNRRSTCTMPEPRRAQSSATPSRATVRGSRVAAISSSPGATTTGALAP